MILGDVEKEVLTDMMHALAAFHHVEVLTYCMMTNHFHILVRVPERPDGFDMSLDEVMEKWSRAVGTAWRTGVQRLFAINDLNGSRERAEEEWRKRMLGRMFSLSGGYTGNEKAQKGQPES